MIRSYLYVPGYDERRIAKALDGEADAVVIDLEDAVAPDRKQEARRVTAEVVARPSDKPVFVRINSPSSGLAEDDVAAVTGPGLTGIRIPKTESAAQVRQVAAWLEGRPQLVAIVPLIESALGVERAWEIVAASGEVAAVAMGEADLRADLGVSVDEGLAYARSRCVNAARAAGRIAVQSVYPELRDTAGLRASTQRGRQLGFTGRSAIHPAQVTVINDSFVPSEEERARAEEVMAAYQSGLRDGSGTAVTSDGRFIDEAVVRSARIVLSLATRPHGGETG
ncbi:CoA ester lyase [Acidiferrimicrobium sp. IK]|uniref:HpcH/HpaI aldolase/citrate lyase family protein n=1 Tax=Acidiferrimicrobium sp. IK TaxID=2871700 RepID=UPI0021CB984A|nr:CoA ester lyase [Acidiferrimicrobium sp. IK]MCU4186748.1 CoA ester lyase [Acidiferrimicrobium sp. IK]